MSPMSETTLADGATVRRKDHTDTRSFEIQGIPVSSKTTHVMTSTWTLPHDTGLKVGFASESLTRRIQKLWTREVQTGDQAFDDQVFIRTRRAHHEDVAALLQDADVRSAIAYLVERGADLVLDGTRLVIRTRDAIEAVAPDPTAEGTIVRAAMTLAVPSTPDATP